MPRIGSLLLAGVLLGVPRALDMRCFGARRPRRQQLAPDAASLAGFAEALFTALSRRPWRLVPPWRCAPATIDLRGVARGVDSGGRRVDAITLRVHADGRTRRLLLHAAPERHADAAHELVSRLEPADC